MAPDWTADGLRRESVFLLDRWAREERGGVLREVGRRVEGALKARLKKELRIYMQGLNTTPLHGHTALPGVYRMLGIGLILFVAKGLAAPGRWKEKLISFSFWSINLGLLLMALLSLLPVGLMQTVASVNHGLWYVRSEEFLGTGLMHTFEWIRVVATPCLPSALSHWAGLCWD